MLFVVCFYRVSVVIGEGSEDCGGDYNERNKWRGRENESHDLLKCSDVDDIAYLF